MTGQSPEGADVAAVLAEHVFPGELTVALTEAWFECPCGERIDVPVVDMAVAPADVVEHWAAHVAAALSTPDQRGEAGLRAAVETLAEEGERDGRGNSLDLARRLRAVLASSGADALAQVVRDAKAEALREAADAEFPAKTSGWIRAKLNRRAERIAADTRDAP